MTYPPRPATWAEIEAFCMADGWESVRSTDHVFWQKRLPTGELLQTHRSFGGAMSQNVFGVILRMQLRVSRAEFWRVLATGEPAQRPTPEEDRPPTYKAWVLIGLKKYGLSEQEIREMTPDEAEALLHEKWSSPQT